jgi:hypothetical protein
MSTIGADTPEQVLRRRASHKWGKRFDRNFFLESNLWLK